LENFKWPYLRNGSSDPLHFWFCGGVFEVGGSNGAISGFAKSKMLFLFPTALFKVKYIFLKADKPQLAKAIDAYVKRFV